MVVDVEQADIDQRRKHEQQRQRLINERDQTHRDLRTRFAELADERTHRTPAEIQARGYALEKLLEDLFTANDIEYRGSSRTAHEQIDGSFFFRGFTYLVEARWRKDRPTLNDLAHFKMKVDGKIESTRGLFLSMAGFDEDIIAHLDTISGGRRNVIYVTGHDIALIFEGQISLEDALLHKINAAENRGEYLSGLH